uniref:Uncharacterized protein n=1 Tax=Anguilla anguilla TaxID=7936 RepID=A0A0E9TB07_ANGAN
MIHTIVSSPLPLCPVHRGSICYYGRLCTLIPLIFRLYTTRHMNQSTLWDYVRRG